MHAHTLVWHEALPPWMHKVTGAAAVKQMMLDHIDHVAGHYKGRVAEWDVINEPMSDEDADYGNGHHGLRPALEQHDHQSVRRAPVSSGCRDSGNDAASLIRRRSDGPGAHNRSAGPTTAPRPLAH